MINDIFEKLFKNTRTAYIAMKFGYDIVRIVKNTIP